MVVGANDWLLLTLLGGLAGAVGQAARMIVGIKKVNDRAVAQDAEVSALIEPARLFVSLTIGFVAGALAAIVMNLDLANVTKEQVLELAAAGYAGSDFVEGIINRAVP